MSNLFINKTSRIFTVRLSWDISQPFVCGTLTEVVKYAITAKNGIDYFAEISNMKFKKVSKKQLKNMLSHGSENTELAKELFKRY